MDLINYTTTLDLKHHFYAFKKITIFMLWGSEQYFWSEGVSLKTLFFFKKINRSILLEDKINSKNKI